MQNLYTQNRVDRDKRWVYLILSITIMICLGTVYSWSVFRVQIEELFHIGTTQSGFPYMVSLAMYSLFMFLSGKHLDKFNPGLVIQTGAALVFTGWILSAFAPNIYVLTVTYGIIIGAGVGITYGVPMAVISKLFPEKKGLFVGLVLTGFGLSPLITAPLARTLMIQYGIRDTFLIFGIVFGIIMLVLAQVFRRLAYGGNKSISRVFNIKHYKISICTKNMMKSGNFRKLYFNFIIGTMIGLMLVGITNNIGIDFIKLSPKIVTIYMSLFAIFNGIGRPVFGWLTDQLSPKKAMLISYSMIIVAALLMVIAKEGSIFLYAVAFSIFWFNLGGWLAIAPASTLAMFGTKYYSENFGVVFTAYGIGAIIGVAVSGLLIDLLKNYHFIFYFIIVMCCIGLLSSQMPVEHTRNA